MSPADSIQYGQVKASYFWDDGSGRNGDTGLPASGEPMQKGLFASPSWPLGTEGYVEYNGQRAGFFIGDRGPGHPAENCDVLLDLDGKTFAELTGETFDQDALAVSGGNGHIDVEYHITEWGDGNGNEGAPHAMGDEDNRCEEAVSEPPAQEEDGAQNGTATGTGQQGRTAEAGQQETRPEIAVNQDPGIELAAGETPIATGALTLALLPALIAAVLFTRRRFPVEHPAFGGRSVGRHRKPAPAPAGVLRRHRSRTGE
ncbi:hypothetical protein [Allosalinactinospora lopnorensis]|uniref:hypothetical protein n=1 Tax=Allosalinactinospora lopnorensis TaxID=1352348 RepID=UPI00069659D0|nr:hypothetical protein [Allosalinactinospora lopnorensis]